MNEELKKLNQQLSQVKLREVKGNLYIRGNLPNLQGEKERKTIALKIKNTPEGRKIALAKAKEIDSKLMLGTWEIETKNKLTVAKAIVEFEKDYWKKWEKTDDRIKAWQKNQYPVFNYLPQDEIFNEQLLKKVFESLPPESYKQKLFVRILRPVGKFHNLKFDYTPYTKYKQPEIDLRKLPTDQDIIEAWENEKYLPHKWGLAILATFGLRPHEFYRSEFNLEDEPPLVYVGRRTKKKKERTAYPLPIKGLDLLAVPNQWDKFVETTDLERTNLQLGQNVTEWFRKYPFTPYELRHYYAARGVINGISPLAMAKWMGHSLNVHYQHYGRLIDDAEFKQLWMEKFT